jgi:O-antigen ligase
LKRFHRFSLYGVLTLLFVSGAIWAYFHYLAPRPEEFAAKAKSWSLKAHGAAAMASLVLIGTVLATHVKFAWRAGRNRINGILLLSTLGVLVVTGYALYYAGGERLRAWTSWIHLGIGLALPAIVVLHVWVGRGTRPAAQVRKHPIDPLQSAKIILRK